MDFYVSPNGNDSNPGTATEPFLTIQRAVDEVPNGGIGNITLEPGTYDENVNCTYHKVYQINGNGNKDNIVVNGYFWAQDNVILTLQNMSFKGVKSRQFAILDYFNVNFLDNTGDFHVAANEMSKINNLGNVHILGNAAGHMIAGHNSVILSSASITVPQPINLSYFAVSSRGSIIELGTVYTTGIYGMGMLGITGQRYAIDSTSIIGFDPNFYWGTLT